MAEVALFVLYLLSYFAVMLGSCALFVTIGEILGGRRGYVIALIVWAAIGVVAHAFVATSAQAHGAYAWIMGEGMRNPVTGEYCCGKEDCFEVRASDVFEDGDSYRIQFLDMAYPEKVRGQVVFFPKAQVQPSKDGKIWVCFNLYAMRPRCMFVFSGM